MNAQEHAEHSEVKDVVHVDILELQVDSSDGLFGDLVVVRLSQVVRWIDRCRRQ